MFHVARESRQAVGVVMVVSFLLGMCALSHADVKNSDLIKALGNENRGWRYSSAKTLGDRGVKEAVEPMIVRLKVEKDPSIRIVIALSLHKIGDHRAIEALQNMARTDTDRRARTVAAAAAADMEKTAFHADHEQEDER